MKKIIGFLVAALMCISFTSCATAAQAQVQVDDMYDNVNISLVVKYGTPCYNAEGLILYYIYRDWFYYPFYYNDRYYFHRYRKPIPTERMGIYKPIPRDFYRNHETRVNHVTPPNKTTPHIVPNKGNDRIIPNMGNKRTIPNTNGRSNGNVAPNVSGERRGNSSTPSINRNSGNMHSTPMTPRSSTRATNSHGNFGGRRR